MSGKLMGFVGDGVNDTLALAAASLAIAIGQASKARHEDSKDEKEGFCRIAAQLGCWDDWAEIIPIWAEISLTRGGSHRVARLP